MKLMQEEVLSIQLSLFLYVGLCLLSVDHLRQNVI